MGNELLNLIGSIVALISVGVFATFLFFLNIKKDEIWDYINSQFKERR